MNGSQWKFVEDAMDQPEKLTDWEQEFVDNLFNNFEDRELSEKQNAILNKISQKLQ